jgi:hypothetical protein
MVDELSEHCLCDKCSGEDCGANTREEAQPPELTLPQILAAWAYHNISEYKDAESYRDDTQFSSGEFSGIVENSKNLLELLKEYQENPKALIQRAKDENWLSD